jgi:hypothetical protein
MAVSVEGQEPGMFLNEVPNYLSGYVEFQSNINQSQAVILESFRVELDDIQVDRSPQLICQTFKMLDRLGVRITNLGWGETPEIDFQPFAMGENDYRPNEILPPSDFVWKLTKETDQFFFHRTNRLGMSFQGIAYSIPNSTQKPKVSRRLFGDMESQLESRVNQVVVPRQIGENSGPPASHFRMVPKSASTSLSSVAIEYLAIQQMPCTYRPVRIEPLKAFGSNLAETPTFYSQWYLRLPDATWELTPEMRTSANPMSVVYGISFEVAPDKPKQTFVEKEIQLPLSQGQKFEFPIYFHSERSINGKATVWATYKVAGTERRAEVKIIDQKRFQIQAPNTRQLLKDNKELLQSMIQKDPGLVADARKLAVSSVAASDGDLLDAYSLLRASGNDDDADRILNRLADRPIDSWLDSESTGLMFAMAADRPKILLEKLAGAIKLHASRLEDAGATGSQYPYDLAKAIPLLLASDLTREDWLRQLRPHLEVLRKFSEEDYGLNTWRDLAIYLGDEEMAGKMAESIEAGDQDMYRAAWLAKESQSPKLQSAIRRLMQSEHPSPGAMELLLKFLEEGKDDQVHQFIANQAKDEEKGQYAAAFFEALEYFGRYGTDRSEGIELLAEYRYSKEVRDRARQLLESP